MGGTSRTTLQDSLNVLSLLFDRAIMPMSNYVKAGIQGLRYFFYSAVAHVEYLILATLTDELVGFGIGAGSLMFSVVVGHSKFLYFWITKIAYYKITLMSIVV